MDAELWGHVKGLVLVLVYLGCMWVLVRDIRDNDHSHWN
jgi:hypothetical protein